MHWLSIALGGAFGAMGRYAIATHLVPVSGNRYPTGTLVANLIGCCLIGFFYVLIVERELLPPPWRPFIITGVLGALTTFSTFALEAVELWHFGHSGVAISYVLSSVVGCLGVTAATLVLSRHLLA